MQSHKNNMGKWMANTEWMKGIVTKLLTQLQKSVNSSTIINFSCMPEEDWLIDWGLTVLSA